MNDPTKIDETDLQRDPLAELVRAGGRRVLPPAEDYEFVLAAAAGSWQRAVRARRRRQWAGAIAATLAACAIGLTGYRYWIGVRPGEVLASANIVRGHVSVLRAGEKGWEPLFPGAAIANGARLRTQGDAAASLSLAAGGLMRLGDSTELAFVSDAHFQLIAGRAYIDSGAPDRRHRFIVDTSFGTVHDIGTVFEVRTAPNALRVRVREGSVRLDALAGRLSIEGHAGEELQVDAQGAPRRGAFPTAGPDWAWAEALAAAPNFDGQPLLRFLKWVARETGRPLRFQESDGEAQAASVMLHGSAHDLKPLDALELMLAATDFDYALSDDGAILIRRRAPAG
jgi:ferric-dicitrate binding protein FerR (iron transport regulator)